MAEIRTGKPDVSHDTPSHTPHTPSGNTPGNYESQPGHLEDGRATAKRSTGVNAGPHNPIDPRMPNLSPP